MVEGTVARNEVELRNPLLSGDVAPPGAKDRRFARAFGGSWGAYLNNPEFETIEGFKEALAGLDSVKEHQAGYMKDSVFVATDRYKALVSSKSGEMYSMPTEKYKPVQDSDVFLPMLEICEKNDLEPVGRIDGIGTGRSCGHILFKSPKFSIDAMDVSNDRVLLGVKLWNSYTGMTSFGGEIFGIRNFCSNYMLMGELLGKFSYRHSKNLVELQVEFKTLITDCFDKIPNLKKHIADAKTTIVVRTEIEDLLWGSGMPKKGIELITDKPESWCPEIETEGLNRWTLFNTATAYVTYRTNGGRFLKATEDHSRSANRLLYMNHDKLIQIGRKRKDAYEELIRNQAKAREKLAVTVVA